MRVNPLLLPSLPYMEKASPDPLSSPWSWAVNLTTPIKIKTLKGWLAACDADHGDHCKHTDTSERTIAPIWLIDVRRRCIVRAEPEFQYATLSYVWGKAESAALTTQTKAEFLKEGSLKASILPRVIWDSMKLVAALEMTYLWVDRLCIVQDSVVEKQAQIKVMRFIYSNSYVTIIAAEARDATYPLSARPLGSVTRPYWLTHWSRSTAEWKRLPAEVAETLVAATKALISPILSRMRRDDEYSYDIAYFDGERNSEDDPLKEPETHADVMRIMMLDLLRTRWNSRGWTFQELLFSRRKILFHNNTVNWECHCASAHEHQHFLRPEPCSNAPLRAALGVEGSNWPNFHRYSRLVALYTIRNLTYPEDSLDAFSGVSLAMAQTFRGGLITGLPQMVFDAALIWQPFNQLQRREVGYVTPEEAILPSWSWMSWRGNIQSESLQSGYDYLRFQPGSVLEGDLDVPSQARAPSPWPTFSTVQWFHSKSLTSDRQPIQVLSNEWRQKCRDSNTDTTAGWERHYDTVKHEAYFTHTMIPKREFQYPIPITDTTPSEEGNDARSRYLHGKTRQAQLRASPELYRSHGTSCLVAAFQNAEGAVIGALRLNGRSRDVRMKHMDAYQVIELSAGSVSLDPSGGIPDHPLADVFDEWALPSWSNKTGLYKFYNVMHITWSDGIAYRVAVGRVEKSAWETAAKEELEVTLG
ncbi:HET-domain-containing protein [Thozetella sp. PMI_491]|nr:HET-domain-containing protein [Thozetella sp. PMI_491]